MCWLMTWRFHSFLLAKVDSQLAQSNTQWKGRVCCLRTWLASPSSSLNPMPEHSGQGYMCPADLMDILTGLRAVGSAFLSVGDGRSRPSSQPSAGAGSRLSTGRPARSDGSSFRPVGRAFRVFLGLIRREY